MSLEISPWHPLSLLLLGLAAASQCPVAAEVDASPVQSVEAAPTDELPNVLHLGIAPGTWQGLNRNDATAAVGAWARSILKTKGVSLTVNTRLYDSEAALAEALRSGAIDCTSMGSDQFFGLDPDLQPDEAYLAVKNDSVGDSYVLLVSADGPIHEISALRHRKLLYLSTARTALGMPWLETLFAGQSMRTPSEEMADITLVDKPSKAILPVFFHQVDACLVTSNAFAMAGELNPQLFRSIRVLASSPEYVASLFFFRKGCASSLRSQLEPAILTLHETPAGLQVLTAFQCQRMVKCPVSTLENVKDLLLLRERLRKNGPRLPAAFSASDAGAQKPM